MTLFIKQRVNIIRIVCSSIRLQLKVHRHAFDSSSGYTGAFYIDGCDMRLLDMVNIYNSKDRVHTILNKITPLFIVVVIFIQF